MPEAARAKARATYDDIHSLPEHQTGEIIDGNLHVSSRPHSKHALAAMRLAERLGCPFDLGTDAAEPFEAIELDLGPLWGEAEP
jgi:hypothetical protein